jgi:hypothetical protein
MRFRDVLCRFPGVLACVRMVTMRHVRVVARQVRVARVVMGRGFAMVLGGVLVVIRSQSMVMRGVLGHGPSFGGHWRSQGPPGARHHPTRA